ncbi:MAG: UDP-N-acetylglucosamine 2-epimerase [Halioglobus sp.]
MKNVAIFTSTRADYGLLYPIAKRVAEDSSLKLQLIVTGTHLSEKFGNTAKEIESDGFEISASINMGELSGSPINIAESIGRGISGYGAALNDLQPDIIVILGDRYEALAMAQVAVVFHVPIVHLHGGEITEGAYDDCFRHAITKLSNIHCASTEEHRARIIQLGENPLDVHNVGALGVENIHTTKFMSLNAMSKEFEFEIGEKYFIVTYHPVTLFDEDPIEVTKNMLEALDDFADFNVIITYPNSDERHEDIISLLEKYRTTNPERVFLSPSLGRVRYLSLLNSATLAIGNTSSGIIEVPSFKCRTINIGERQKGRMAAKSVINCRADSNSIRAAIRNGIESPELDDEFDNPYGKGDTSIEILKLIRTHQSNQEKVFVDLKFD